MALDKEPSIKGKALSLHSNRIAREAVRNKGMKLLSEILMSYKKSSENKVFGQSLVSAGQSGKEQAFPSGTILLTYYISRS